jgi:hypothetical protein
MNVLMILVYIFYLLSGIIKTLFIYYGIHLPIDITLLAAIILVLHIVLDNILRPVNLIVDRTGVTALSILTVFFVWIVISLTYTRSEFYSFEKTMLFLTNVVAFIYPMFIKDFDIKKFLRYLVVAVNIFFIWFYKIYFILNEKYYGTEMFYQVMGLYLTLATVEGLVLLVLVTSPEKIFNINLLRIFFIALSFAFLVLSGARGPLIFAVLALILFYGWKFMRLKVPRRIDLNRYAKFLFLGLPIVTVAIIYGFYKFHDKITELLDRSLYRISLFINGVAEKSDLGESVDTRVDQIKFSLDSIFQGFKSFLLGFGFGSFGTVYTGEDVRLYPHNILLEVWFELGAVGLTIFLCFLLTILIGRMKPKAFIVGIIVIYIVLNMLKSSSIVDIRIFFTFFAIYIISANLKFNTGEQ